FLDSVCNAGINDDLVIAWVGFKSLIVIKGAVLSPFLHDTPPRLNKKLEGCVRKIRGRSIKNTRQMKRSLNRLGGSCFGD
ncbi:MAG: hypothetical protein KC563_04320, partial [Nitrospira sp.]|nr:hypothetical protein [Nitrospira sp.]